MNRRRRFALTRNAAPHVPSVRARLEPARSPVEPPTPRNYDLRLRGRRTEDQRPPLEQLDLISRCAGARRPYKATRGRCNRGRLRSSRGTGSGDSTRIFPGARRVRERGTSGRRGSHSRSIAVDYDNRRDGDRHTYGGCNHEPASPPDRKAGFLCDRRPRRRRPPARAAEARPRAEAAPKRPVSASRVVPLVARGPRPQARGRRGRARGSESRYRARESRRGQIATRAPSTDATRRCRPAQQAAPPRMR